VKILVVHNAYQSHQIGGEDIVVANEIRALKAHLGKHNVFFYGVCNDDINPLKLSLKIWGDKTHYHKIYDLVKSQKIDIVHVHNFFPLLTPSVFAAAKAAGASVVHTLHNFRWWCVSGDFYKNNAICEQCIGKKWMWPAIKQGCYRKNRVQSTVASAAFGWYRIKKYQEAIDAYFVLSNFQKEKLKNWLPPEKLLLKPNSIEPPQIYYSPFAKKDYLFVGRIEPAKGIEVLLEAWQTLPTHFHLRLIGYDNADFSQKYQRANIQFLGKMEHKETLTKMSHAKFLLHTSLAYETFGLTIVEALARGTPVIGFNIGTRTELIQHGKNGFLTTPRELKETLLQSFIYADYRAMTMRAKESAKAFFEENVILTQLAHYENLLRSKV